MVKHTQTIRRLLPTNCLSAFDYFVGLTLEGLNNLLVADLSSFDDVTRFVKRRDSQVDPCAF